jgi:hypothetical protein
MISTVSYLHEDEALIRKCDGFLHEFVSSRFSRSVLDLNYTVVASFYIIYLKLKFDLFKCIFPTSARWACTGIHPKTNKQI